VSAQITTASATTAAETTTARTESKTTTPRTSTAQTTAETTTAPKTRELTAVITTAEEPAALAKGITTSTAALRGRAWQKVSETNIRKMLYCTYCTVLVIRTNQ
jgi:hypothetical protein